MTGLRSRFLRPFSSKRHPTGCRADDATRDFETENATFLRKSAALHQCRVKEDEAWKKSQVDPVVKQLQAADKRQDNYMSCFHSIVNGYGSLPDDEALKAARRATDLAVADLYKTINAMMDLMPSDALTALYTQLKGFELYAKQYYLPKGKDEPEPEPEPEPDPEPTPVTPE